MKRDAHGHKGVFVSTGHPTIPNSCEHKNESLSIGLPVADRSKIRFRLCISYSSISNRVVSRN